MLIGIDFDGTMFDRDQPLPGVKDAINVLREKGHKVMIFSCNSTKWIEKCLNNHDIRFDYIWEGDKPNCGLFIDDRGYRFPRNGDWSLELPKITEIVDKGVEPYKW